MSDQEPLCICIPTTGLAFLLDLASLLVLTCSGVHSHMMYSKNNPDIFDS